MNSAQTLSQQTFSVSRRHQTPAWDRAARELRLGGVLVKGFAVPADCQELLLSAFEEQGWPDCIDDPLSPKHGVDPKRRLSKTVAKLNKHQANPLVRFRGNGRGTGVRWERIGGGSGGDRG
jgi:hypothetical protein